MVLKHSNQAQTGKQLCYFRNRALSMRLSMIPNREVIASQGERWQEQYL
jgi:hypothetical protein